MRLSLPILGLCGLLLLTASAAADGPNSASKARPKALPTGRIDTGDWL
jgi:hypothetical protein